MASEDTPGTFISAAGGVHDKPVGYKDKQDLPTDHDDVEATANSLEHRPTDFRFGERPGILRGQVEVRMLVSGKHLELSSPYFRKMFAGPYTEGRADHWGLRRVTASDWDPEALNIVLNIIHCYHRDVPKSLDLEMLAKLAVIVDYYGCHESVEVYIEIWLNCLEQKMPAIYGRDCMLWLLISWVFSRKGQFRNMSRLALQSSMRLIEARDLPIPADLLKQIDQARQDAVAQVFAAVYDLLDLLQEESECSYECSSILLGSLMKELSKHGVLNPRITTPFHGFSLQGCKDMIKNFPVPQWCTYPLDRYRHYNSAHSCSIQNKLATALEKVDEQLRDFELGIFNPRRVR